jgi:hypothetical protein
MPCWRSTQPGSATGPNARGERHSTLYDRLVAGERRIARAITAVAIESLGELAAGEDAERKLLLIFSACRGLALTEQLEPRKHRRREQWPRLRAELLAALTPERR